MRRIINWGGISIVFVFLSLLLHSCGVQNSRINSSTQNWAESEAVRYQRKQERLRREYGTALEMAADQLVKEFSKQLSPRSGKDFVSKVHYYEYEVVENTYDGYISCRATLRWMARDWWSGVPYDWCELQGTLYFYPKVRSIDVNKAAFTIDYKNDQVTKVSSTSSWAKVKDGIVINL